MNGVAYVWSAMRLPDITDGTSNTYLVLELAHSGNHSWLVPGHDSNPFMFVHHASEGYCQSTNAPNDTTSNTRDPQSFHIGGVQVVMCDGHVTFISNSIDFATYRAMYTPQGGEDVSVP